MTGSGSTGALEHWSPIQASSCGRYDARSRLVPHFSSIGFAAFPCTVGGKHLGMQWQSVWELVERLAHRSHGLM